MIAKEAKINHLSYIGDSEIGEGVNVGAGVITCNYDGKKKHKTIIEKNSFIGSNAALIAPVTLAKNTKVAAGSVVTDNVNQEGSLVIARSRQIIKNPK